MMDIIFSWNTVWYLLMLIYVPCCFGLVIVVLLQKGKGVGFAGAFGAGGGSDAVFGPRSSKSLPQRITYSMAALFMLLALIMSMLSGRVGSSAAPGLVDDTGMSAGISAPAGSLGALFESDAPAAQEVTPAVDTPVETPAEDAAPAEETPAAEAPAETTEAAPASDAAPDGEAEAPAEETPQAQ